MSRRRFVPKFNGGSVQMATQPGDMRDLFDPMLAKTPGTVIEAATARMATRCLVPSCTRPVHSRVYTHGKQQLGACRHPLHQALMKRRQVVRTWYWEGA